MWKRLCFAFLIVSITSYGANAQLTKGNWLVGGSGSFSIQQQKATTVGKISSTRLQIMPNIGYFFVEKLAAGLKSGLDIGKNTYGGSTVSSNSIKIGPFVRYYILPSEKLVNLLTEANYQHLSGSNNYSRNLYTFSAGPVIYFNTSVGLEATLNYEIANSKNSNATAKTFFLGLGFQIHLDN